MKNMTLEKLMAYVFCGFIIGLSLVGIVHNVNQSDPQSAILFALFLGFGIFVFLHLQGEKDD